MEFSELIVSRYSVRSYKPDPVAKDKLYQILEAARIAPTAANRQPFRVIVLDNKGRKDELKRVYRADWLSDAPTVICVCMVPSEGWVRKQDNKNHDEIDAAIAMDHIILAATNLGLGTCWIAAFDPDAAREVFNLPENLVPVLLTPLGYPADEPAKKTRRPLEEIVSFVR